MDDKDTNQEVIKFYCSVYNNSITTICIKKVKVHDKNIYMYICGWSHCLLSVVFIKMVNISKLLQTQKDVTSE